MWLTCIRSAPVAELAALRQQGYTFLTMIADIRKLTAGQPFIPFTLHLADGGQVRVPTLDHVYVFPQGSRVLVTYDDDSYDVISPLLVSRITVDRQPAQ